MIKSKGIIISVLIILLVFLSTIAVTYSVVINVASNNGINEIVNVIRIRDLMTDNNGNYNSAYYNVKNKLNISDEEANLLMGSSKLNESLKIVLNSIVSYKVDNDLDSKMSNDELYNLIVSSVNEDDNISNNLKNKVIENSKIYIDDISKFLYDIDVSLLGNN